MDESAATVESGREDRDERMTPAVNEMVYEVTVMQSLLRGCGILKDNHGEILGELLVFSRGWLFR